MKRERIGRYRIGERIGAGAMGEVYRARDEERGIDVAVKVLAGDMSDEEELVERFRREAQSAAAMDHPNIIRVYDFGEDDRNLYMVMELLRGSDLKELIEAGSLELPQKFSIMLQVAEGMGFVHERDLVHRDLKPGNIHVQPDGVAKIMDFGLVRLGDSNMTRAGMVMGSPSYMAPEQMRGQRATVSSDVFSLGAVYWELLAGKRAFDGKGIHQILLAVLSHEPQPVNELVPEVPPRLAEVIARCLLKDPAQRYQNAAELRDALRALTPQGSHA